METWVVTLAVVGACGYIGRHYWRERKAKRARAGSSGCGGCAGCLVAGRCAAPRKTPRTDAARRA